MLHEKHRPKTWSDVVGQDKAVSTLQRLPFGGNALWITGQSGTGKSTLANLYAIAHCDPSCVNEYAADDLMPGTIREINRQMSVRGFAPGGRCVILNESHGLRKDTIRALLVALEPIPSHACWIFTTTNDGAQSLFEDCDDGSPLVSRCFELPLARRDLSAAFADRLLWIASQEGWPITLPECVRLAKDCRNNLRMMIGRAHRMALEAVAA